MVGVNFSGADYAYPYAALFHYPVVVQSDHDKKMLLLWSAYANRILAFRVSADVKGRDLEVVSMPANALLVYDSRTGQFINGLKGLTIDGRRPSGFLAPLLTTKTTWRRWIAAHPECRVMALRRRSRRERALPAPSRPILPAYQIPGQPPGDVASRSASRRVTIVGWVRPTALIALVSTAPINLAADGAPTLLFRPTAEGAARAFEGQFGKDPTTLAAAPGAPWFIKASEDRRRPRSASPPSAAFRETETNTIWTIDGTGIAGRPIGGETPQAGRGR